MITRSDGRSYNQLRNIDFITDYMPSADGSCLLKMGNTHVICSATIDEQLPNFLKNQNMGWITAEYNMLPCATKTRTRREATLGKQTGRTQEIQRLIGRSLRAVTDLQALGERQILIDCDVIRADGGTRTASITGSFIALYCALRKLNKEKKIRNIPIIESIAAISCGIVNGNAILDINYEEDSIAAVDANFVMTDSGKIVEIQATSEKSLFDNKQFTKLLELAKHGIKDLIIKQNQILGL